MSIGFAKAPEVKAKFFYCEGNIVDAVSNLNAVAFGRPFWTIS